MSSTGSSSVEKLNKVLSWLQNKSSPALSAVESMVLRLCRNFRIDKRPDFDAPVFGEIDAPDATNLLLVRSCRVGRRLKLILDTVVLSRRSTDPMPKFLTPALVSLALPEFAHHVDEAKLQAVFGKLLYAFLLKMWTPLRYAEELLSHLNTYCAGLQDLARDTATAPPKDANSIALAVLEQLKRLDSNLSRIEVFVLTKHNQPPQSQITQLLELRSKFMRAELKEDDYRDQKSGLLDKLVEFNTQQFRPTAFFLLASPDDASRASISPNVILDKSFQSMMSEAMSSSTGVVSASKNKNVTMDDILAIASPKPSLKPMSARHAAARNTVAFGETPVSNPLESSFTSVASPPPPAVTNSDTKPAVGRSPRAAARNTMQWESADVLKSPISMTDSNSLMNVKLSDTKSVSASVPVVVSGNNNNNSNNRSTVSFEPQQLQKFNELEKLKNSSMQDIAQLKAKLEQPSLKLETHSKTLDLGKNGSVNFVLEFTSQFVCANQILFLYVTLENKAKGAVVEMLEVTLRDPSFARVLHFPNILDEWSKGGGKKEPLFPLKANCSASIRYALRLPFLEPVAQRSRYTLLLVPTGRKLKNFQLSVPLAVVPPLKLYEHIPTQVFFTPLDVIAKRENTHICKVLSECLKFIETRTLLIHRSFNHELLSEEEEVEVSLLTEGFNRGVGSLAGVTSTAVVARLFSNFFLTLPEPLIPEREWQQFKAAASQNDELKRLSDLQNLCIQMAPVRKALVVTFLDFVAYLDKKGAFGGSFEYLSAAVVRPPGRSAQALAVGEASDANRIMTYLVKLSPFEKK